MEFRAVLLRSSATVNGFAGIGASLSDATSTATVQTSGALGFTLGTSSLELAIVQDSTSGATYAGVEASLTNAGLIGIPELTLIASGAVQANDSTTAERLDWAAVTGTGNALESIDLDIDETVVFAASGSAALDAFGVLVASGSFNLELLTGIAIDDGQVTGFTADVLTISATVNGFAGIGASLSDATSTATVQTSGALGFTLGTSSLELAIVQDSTSGATYAGVEASLTNAGLIGIPELTLIASGAVQANDSTTAERLDWAAVTGTGNALESIDLDIDETVVFAASGSAALDAFGVLVASGSFNLELLTGIAIDDGQVTGFTADVLTISATVNGFAGIGASLSDATSTATVQTSGALGFTLGTSSLELAIVQDSTSGATYAGVEASLTNAGLIGIPELTLIASGAVQANDSTSAERLGWAAGRGRGYALESIDLDIDETVVFAASGSAALDAFGVLVASGSFNLELLTGIAIDDGQVTGFTADVLTLSTTLSGFVGVGGSLSDATSSASVITTGAIGFALTDASVDLVVLQDAATPGNQYVGAEATLADARLQGVTGLALWTTGTAKLNTTTAANEVRLDWTEVTGAGNELPDVELDISSAVAFQIQGSAALDVAGILVAYTGEVELTFATVTVNDGTCGAPTLTGADVISIEVDDAAVFAGWGGALLAGHGGLDIDEINDNGTGFLVSGADFRMVLVRGAVGDGANAGDTYLGIEASLTAARLIGVDGIDVWATGTVKFNQAIDADGVTALPARMDWGIATTTNDSGALLADLAIDSAVELELTGSAAIGASFSVGVLAHATGVRIHFRTMDVTDGDVTIFDANVVSIRVTGASIFVGSGGRFLPLFTGLDLAEIEENGVGFLAAGMSFSMVLARGMAIDVNVNATRWTGDQTEVAIAVNPNDPDNIIAAPIDRDPLGGVFGTPSRESVWVSKNGGRTFERKTIP